MADRMLSGPLCQDSSAVSMKCTSKQQAFLDAVLIVFSTWLLVTFGWVRGGGGHGLFPCVWGEAGGSVGGLPICSQ